MTGTHTFSRHRHTLVTIVTHHKWRHRRAGGSEENIRMCLDRSDDREMEDKFKEPFNGKFLILVVENICEFVEKELTEVLFGKPFKDNTGLEEDLKGGVIWFKIGNDKTIFNMPRAETRFRKLTTEHHSMMSPILKISNENMAKGIRVAILKYSPQSSESKSEETGVIDIETLTLKQYLALEQGTTNRKEQNPEDGNFEIKGQFLRELRDNSFDGNESKEAFEHLRKIQEITSWFNTPGFSNEATMLKVFPISLVGTTKRWFKRTPARAVKTWDELK
ncbi:hypothetical protein Tco_0247976 [Tanacetum coccineum]